MSAMPERVWVDELVAEEDGPPAIAYRYDPEDAGFTCYVPESRLLAAEARVRELEQIHRDEMDLHDEMEAKLAAERDALVPLARAGLNAYDYALAKEQYGSAIVPVLDRVSIDESLATARAILDRVATEEGT